MTILIIMVILSSLPILLFYMSEDCETKLWLFWLTMFVLFTYRLAYMIIEYLKYENALITSWLPLAVVCLLLGIVSAYYQTKYAFLNPSVLLFVVFAEPLIKAAKEVQGNKNYINDPTEKEINENVTKVVKKLEIEIEVDVIVK